MNEQIIFLISNIFLVIFTSVLAFFTYYLWQEAKKSREYQIELNKPELSLIFEPSKKYVNFIYLNLKNIGRSPIYNLKLKKVEEDFSNPHNNKKISKLNYLKNINYLRPNQEINQFFMSLHSFKEKKIEDLQFSMYFEYEDSKHKNYYRKFNFDFSQFLDMSQVGEEPINKIADSLDKINNEIGHLTSGFKKLQVITQTKKEKQEEEKKIFREINKKNKLMKKQKK